MRWASLLLACALVGCAGTAALPNQVRVTNETADPITVTVQVLDARGALVFSHGFMSVQPGQGLEVAHAFDGEREHLVNVSALLRQGDEVVEAWGEQRVTIAQEAIVDVTVAADGKLAIVVLATERRRAHRRRRGA